MGKMISKSKNIILTYIFDVGEFLLYVNLNVVVFFFYDAVCYFLDEYRIKCIKLQNSSSSNSMFGKFERKDDIHCFDGI